MLRRLCTMVLIVIACCACAQRPSAVDARAVITQSPSAVPSPGAAPSAERLPPAASFTPSPATPSLASATPATPAPATPAPRATMPPAATDMELYKRVFSGEGAFYSAYLGKDISLIEYCQQECTVDDFEAYFEFAVVDMDGDGAAEVILYIGPPGVNIVFHCADGVVYGYSFGTSETQNMRTDGSFELDGSSWAICELKFNKEVCEYREIAAAQYPGGRQTPVYFLNGKRASKDAFDAFCAEQQKKDPACWYAVNDDNLNAQLRGSR